MQSHNHTPASLLFIIALFLIKNDVARTANEQECEILKERHCPPDREKIKYIQMYHISKAGGTTLRRVLKNILDIQIPTDDSAFSHLRPGSEDWRLLDIDLWRSEKENQPDVRYNRDPSNFLKQETFIIGQIRNPFSYYRSYHSMVTADNFNKICKDFLKSHGTIGNFKYCFCEMKVAYETNKAHLFLNETSIRNNKTSFQEFVHFLLSPEVQRCTVAMQDRHDHMMNMRDGSFAYDVIVKQESFWSDLTNALQAFDCCFPNRINWDRFLLFSTDASFRHQSRSMFHKGFKLYPDFCFYTKELKEMVEIHDAAMMTIYQYSWESFVGDRNPAECAGLN